MSETPTFLDLYDILDAMMSPPPHRLPARASVWHARHGPLTHASAILEWLVRFGFAHSRQHAAQLSTYLVRVGGLIPEFRVQNASEAFRISPLAGYTHRGLSLLSRGGLNCLAPFLGLSRHARVIFKELGVAFRRVCDVAVSLDGRFVEYAAIRGSVGYRLCLFLLSELESARQEDVTDMTNEERKIGFLNLYNLLIFHAKLVLSHPTDLIKRSAFFNTAAYVIAGVRITSIMMEHVILRAKTGMNADIPQQWMLNQVDCRIHFILNCGAQSCPPIVVVDHQTPEASLKEAAVRFIDENCVVDLQAGKVTLSRLWKWFRPDFCPDFPTSDSHLLQRISGMASHQMAHNLSQILSRKSFRIKFVPYNWADNGDVTAKPDIRFMSIYDISFAKSV